MFGRVFVVLEHDPTPTGGGREVAVHWDLIVEVAGADRLPTWQLAENPVGATVPIAARRIEDHRRVYLDYEGAISGDRGHVRRIARGTATIERQVGDELRVELMGERLRGRFEVVRLSEGQLVFRAAVSVADVR